jgi:hypothetical protein
MAASPAAALMLIDTEISLAVFAAKFLPVPFVDLILVPILRAQGHPALRALRLSESEHLIASSNFFHFS